MVPEGWITVQLGDLSSLKLNNGAFNDPKSVGSGYKLINVVDLYEPHKINPSKLKRLNIRDEEYEKYSAKAGDLFFTRSSLKLEGIAHCARFKGDDEKVIFECHIIRFRPNQDKVYPDYLYEYCLSSKARKHFFSYAKTGTMTTIDQKSISKLNVLLPPLQEQKKIAQILSTWDKAISTTEKLLKNSQQQKKALMQQLITGKKRLKGFSGEFKRFHFSQLLEIDKQNLGSKTKPDFAFDYISLSDVSPGAISRSLEKYSFKDAPSRARRIVQDGDILLATVRPNLQGFARVRKVNDGAIASTGFAVLTPKSNVYGDYVYHYLFGAHITGQINALVVGTNYPAINSSDVAGLCIYCPCYEEQKEIAEVLNNCDSTTQSLNNKLEKLKQEKKALMQQLLTGKRRVK